MKRIPMRTIHDEHFPPGTPEFAQSVMVWADVIRQVIRRPMDPSKGADIEEMRRGIRVLDAVDRAGQYLELEDADYEHLKEKTKLMQWAFVDRRLVTFIDDVNNATEEIPESPNGHPAILDTAAPGWPDVSTVR